MGRSERAHGFFIIKLDNKAVLLIGYSVMFRLSDLLTFNRSFDRYSLSEVLAQSQASVFTEIVRYGVYCEFVNMIGSLFAV